MGYKSRLFNDEVYMSGCHLQIFPLDDEGTGQANQHPWHRRPRQCKPFLSVMHGKAHNWSCQVCNDCLFCLIFSHVFLWDGGEKSERVSYFCFDRKGNKIIDKMGRKMAVWIRLCNRRGNGAV